MPIRVKKAKNSKVILLEGNTNYSTPLVSTYEVFIYLIAINKDKSIEDHVILAR